MKALPLHKPYLVLCTNNNINKKEKKKKEKKRGSGATLLT
jgi:hypothetical protein